MRMLPAVQPRRHPSWSLTWALVVLAASGCSPFPAVQGVARLARRPCASVAGGVIALGAPIAGASVGIVCPDGAGVKSESGADGRFRGEWRPGEPMSNLCVVHVEKQGYMPRDYAVADICGSPRQRAGQPPSCISAVLVAELIPAGSPP